MTSPRLVTASESQRTEAEVRELARTKIRAKAAWDAFLSLNAAGLTEEQQIDRELESQRLHKAYYDASLALTAVR